MKRKRPVITLTADELDIVRRANDLGREVIGDWLEDKLCSIADNDSASSNCETSPGWNLSWAGARPPQRRAVTGLFSFQQTRRAAVGRPKSSRNKPKIRLIRPAGLGMDAASFRIDDWGLLGSGAVSITHEFFPIPDYRALLFLSWRWHCQIA